MFKRRAPASSTRMWEVHTNVPDERRYLVFVKRSVAYGDAPARNLGLDPDSALFGEFLLVREDGTPLQHYPQPQVTSHGDILDSWGVYALLAGQLIVTDVSASGTTVQRRQRVVNDGFWSYVREANEVPFEIADVLERLAAMDDVDKRVLRPEHDWTGRDWVCVWACPSLRPWADER